MERVRNLVGRIKESYKRAKEVHSRYIALYSVCHSVLNMHGTINVKRETGDTYLPFYTGRIFGVIPFQVDQDESEISFNSVIQTRQGDMEVSLSSSFTAGFKEKRAIIEIKLNQGHVEDLMCLDPFKQIMGVPGLTKVARFENVIAAVKKKLEG